MTTTHDLIVIGGNAGGLSAAVFARRSGLDRVAVIERGTNLALPGVAGEHGLDVSYGETVTAVDLDGDDLVVTTSRQTYRSRGVLVALRTSDETWTPPIDTITGDRVHVDRIPSPANDVDVLVIGHTDHAVELTVRLADEGAGVVLAAGGMNPRRLSPIGAQLLNGLERDRRATLLYRSVPEQIADVDGFPMAYFNDRRTPDLQFDQVVFSSGRTAVTPATVGATDAALGERSGLVPRRCRRDPRGRAQRPRRQHRPRARDRRVPRRRRACPRARGHRPPGRARRRRGAAGRALQRHDHPLRAHPLRPVGAAGEARPRLGVAPPRPVRVARPRLLGGAGRRRHGAEHRRPVGQARPPLVLDLVPHLRRARLPGQRRRGRRARVLHRPRATDARQRARPPPAWPSRSPATASTSARRSPAATRSPR